MSRARAVCVVVGGIALSATSFAQTRPEDSGPPPPAPPANWAPPLPAEPPPPPPPEGAPPAKATPAQTREEEEARAQAEGLPGPEEGAASEQTSTAEQPATTMDIYGFTMLDTGYDFGRIGDPNWQDVLRPTKLPAFRDQFGKGDRTFLGVRQTRFGVSSKLPTRHGDVDTKFEFELFGVGVDEGQTTFRLRHAYGTYRHVTAGQTWSPFMDPDVFPDSIEYWGPNGMVFFRNVQLSYMPYENGETNVVIAAERPGASADQASFTAARIDLDNIVGRFPAPDVSGHIRIGGTWGHVQAAGIFRYIKWDDVGPSPTVEEGHVFGWGLNLSGVINLEQFAPVKLKLQVAGGRAIENYMNDAAFDVGPKPSNNPALPVKGVGLPVIGLVAFADINWSKRFTSTVGYSFVSVDNSSGQEPSAFHEGHYALGNVLLHPLDDLFFGPELQWGRRVNNSDGFTANDYRIQFSVKYVFSQSLKGKKSK